MLLIYPLLGVSAFEVVQERPRGDARLFLRGKDAKTEGADRAEGFVVFAGATIRSDTVPSILPYQRALREELQKKGVIQPSTDGLVLAEDYVFTLPHLANDCRGRRHRAKRQRPHRVEGQTGSDAQRESKQPQSNLPPRDRRLTDPDDTRC